MKINYSFYAGMLLCKAYTTFKRETVLINRDGANESRPAKFEISSTKFQSSTLTAQKVESFSSRAESESLPSRLVFVMTLFQSSAMLGEIHIITSRSFNRVFMQELTEFCEIQTRTFHSDIKTVKEASVFFFLLN